MPGRGSCTEYVEQLQDAGETETKGDFILKLNSDAIRPRLGIALSRRSNLNVNYHQHPAAELLGRSQTQKISDYRGVKSGAEAARDTMRRRSFETVFETVLVGPSALVREGLTRILCAANFHILDSVGRVEDADVTSRAPQSPVLLIIDSGDASDAAFEQVGRFKKQHSDARIAMLADCYRVNHVMHAFEVGTDAYFVRVANWDAFIKSLELVMLGETILPSALLPSILNHDTSGHRERDPAHDLCASLALQTTESNATPPLSAREQCILRHLIEGHSNKAIARKVDIAEATVKVHVKTILRKIRVQNRTQAAIWAVSNGSFIASTTNGWSGST